MPAAMYRSRHSSTVGLLVCIRSAISVFVTPSAASNTILARATTPAGAVDARVNASNRARSRLSHIQDPIPQPTQT